MVSSEGGFGLFGGGKWLIRRGVLVYLEGGNGLFGDFG